MPKEKTTAPGLRRKALIQAMVVLVVAVLLQKVARRSVWPEILAVLAGLTALLGLTWTAGYGRVDRFFQAVGRLAGQGATWLVLSLFYYLVFVPVRVGLAVRGKDPLHRRFSDALPSYWVPHRPAKGPDAYRRQF